MTREVNGNVIDKRNQATGRLFLLQFARTIGQQIWHIMEYRQAMLAHRVRLCWLTGYDIKSTGDYFDIMSCSDS